MTRDRLQSMLAQGYPMFQYRGAMETTWTASLPEALGRRLFPGWDRAGPAVVDALVLVALAGALAAAAAFAQKRWDGGG